MKKTKQKLPIVNLVLFLVTVATTFSVGYRLARPLVSLGMIEKTWQGAMLFSLSLLTILGCHEMGHKLIAERRGIKVTLPYFIPSFGFLGTLGAFIGMKKRPSNRNALFDVGAAGPVAGFLALLPILVLGLRRSIIVPARLILQEATLPTSLLVPVLQKLMGIEVPEGCVLISHPLAFTAQIGMIVTMLNLMPVGSLDGGHISRALFGGRGQTIISMIAAIITFLLGYWFMGLWMLFIAGFGYEAPRDDITPVSEGRKLVAIAVLCIFILCLTL